jgi:hypothetical protein
MAWCRGRSRRGERRGTEGELVVQLVLALEATRGVHDLDGHGLPRPAVAARFLHRRCQTNRAKATRIGAITAAEAGRWWWPWDRRSATTAAAGGEEASGGGEIFN